MVVIIFIVWVLKELPWPTTYINVATTGPADTSLFVCLHKISCSKSKLGTCNGDIAVGVQVDVRLPLSVQI